MRPEVLVLLLALSPVVRAQAVVDRDRQAAALCGKQFDAPVVGGDILGPSLVMKTWADKDNWLPEAPLAVEGDPSAPRTLFCIRESVKESVKYTDGSTGYSRLWVVVAMSWPDGQVLRRGELGASPPPTVSRAMQEPKPEFASISTTRLLDWILPVAGGALLAEVDGEAFLSPDRRTLVGLRGNPVEGFKAEVLDWPSKAPRHSLDGRPLGFVSDGRLVTLAKKEVLYWEVGTGRQAGRLSTAPRDGMLSPDGTRLIVPQKKGVELWDLASARALPEAKPRGVVVSWPGKSSLSADGSRVCAMVDGKLSLWDQAGGQVVKSFTDKVDFTINGDRCVISADGRWMVLDLRFNPSATMAKGLYRIGVETAAVERVGDAFKDYTCLAVSGDGRWLAASRMDEDLKLWDLARGREVLSRKGPGLINCTLEFSSDGKTLAESGTTGSFQRRTRFWDVAQLLAEATAAPAKP